MKVLRVINICLSSVVEANQQTLRILSACAMQVDIFGNLDEASDLLRAGCVCKAWKDIISDGKWEQIKRVCLQPCPDPLAGPAGQGLVNAMIWLCSHCPCLETMDCSDISIMQDRAVSCLANIGSLKVQYKCCKFDFGALSFHKEAGRVRITVKFPLFCGL